MQNSWLFLHLYSSGIVGYFFGPFSFSFFSVRIFFLSGIDKFIVYVSVNTVLYIDNIRLLVILQWTRRKRRRTKKTTLLSKCRYVCWWLWDDFFPSSFFFSFSIAVKFFASVSLSPSLSPKKWNEKKLILMFTDQLGAES